MEREGVWLPIIEYSNVKGISISTIRRYIKSKKVQSKLVGGKYFIFIDQEKLAKSKEKAERNSDQKVSDLEIENDNLKDELNKLKEQLVEYKMLIDLYEKKDWQIVKEV